MARNEKTSKRIASIAGRGLRAPSTLSCAEIKALCASLVTQAPDHTPQFEPLMIARPSCRVRAKPTKRRRKAKRHKATTVRERVKGR